MVRETSEPPPPAKGSRKSSLVGGGVRPSWLAGTAFVFCSFLTATSSAQKESLPQLPPLGLVEKGEAGSSCDSPQGMTKGRQLWQALQKGYRHAEQQVEAPSGRGWAWLVGGARPGGGAWCRTHRGRKGHQVLRLGAAWEATPCAPQVVSPQEMHCGFRFSVLRGFVDCEYVRALMVKSKYRQRDHIVRG